MAKAKENARWRPPDRDMSVMDSLLTERRNPRSVHIDRMTIPQIVELINSEDRTVPAAVAEQSDRIVAATELVVNRFRLGGRLFYVGAGTSGRLGVLDASECPPTFGTDPAMVQGIIAGGYGALVTAREGAEDVREDGARDLRVRGVTSSDVVMGIATSSVTPYVLGALDEARGVGAATIFLTCCPDKSPPAQADVTISPAVGPEVVTGSTRMKAGTATKLVLNTITTTAMVVLGKTYENLMVDLKVTCDKLRDRCLRILVETAGVSYEEAENAINEADGSVKVAIVMLKGGLGRDEAVKLLSKSDGCVGRALKRLGKA